LWCVGVLNTSGLHYVVAGGWAPLLLGSVHPTPVHSRTRDVDVLMTDELKAVQAAARMLLANRFRPSAKHEFQLLRDAALGGWDFVFNIDLMHPYEAGDTPQMFSDIFDLGVRPKAKASAEPINGLYKAEVAHRRARWLSFKAAKYAIPN